MEKEIAGVDEKEMCMEIIIKGSSKEIAALVLKLQGRRELEDVETIVFNRLQAVQDQNEPVYRP